jgi:hypothetical protein
MRHVFSVTPGENSRGSNVENQRKGTARSVLANGRNRFPTRGTLLQSGDDATKCRLGFAAPHQYRLATPRDRLATNGFASQVERIIERISPESLDVSQRNRLEYELKQVMPFRGESFQDRFEEINQALLISQQLEQLLRNPQTNRSAYEPLLKRIASFESIHAANENIPYREVLSAVRRKAEMARKGELVR